MARNATLLAELSLERTRSASLRSPLRGEGILGYLFGSLGFQRDSKAIPKASFGTPRGPKRDSEGLQADPKGVPRDPWAPPRIELFLVRGVDFRYVDFLRHRKASQTISPARDLSRRGPRDSRRDPVRSKARQKVPQSTLQGSRTGRKRVRGVKKRGVPKRQQKHSMTTPRQLQRSPWEAQDSQEAPQRDSKGVPRGPQETPGSTPKGYLEAPRVPPLSKPPFLTPLSHF